MKDRENYDLLKVPDEIIVRELRIELGKANSRIQELEDELKAHSSGKIHELIKSLKGTIKALVKEKKSDKYYQLYQEQRERNDRLTQSNSALIGKILMLQTKNEKNRS